MKRSLLVVAIIALYLLHQDFWFWRAATPIVFGFLPIGLFYHVCYTLVISVLMWLLVKHAWPSHLEEGQGDGETGRQGEEELIAPSPRRPVAPSSQTEEARRQ
ncbi:MAG: DUF3311 domain-containing protein [Blastocatellia bacterium]